MTGNEPKRIAITSPDLNAERLATVRRLLPDIFDTEGELDEKALRRLVKRTASAEIKNLRFE